MTRPDRVLITLDAVGGVWRYALDLADGLSQQGIACLLVGFGPPPSQQQLDAWPQRENVELAWTKAPLDWMVADETELRQVPDILTNLAEDWQAQLLHLNLPSQAAELESRLPVAVASHSCVPSWWRTVRGQDLPDEWKWQWRYNRMGFDRASAVLAPSASHGATLRDVYGALPGLAVVHNAARFLPYAVTEREDFILSVGRWWDEGKNASVLDDAAATSPWPILMAGPLSGPNGETAHVRNAGTTGSLTSAGVVSLMRRATLFAAPSRYEPFGLAVLEAALNGTPLVLADIPSFREIWGNAAVFVPVSDSTAWSDAFAMLAADPIRRSHLATQAKVRARRYTPRRQIDAVLAAYAGVMRSAKATA